VAGAARPFGFERAPAASAGCDQPILAHYSGGQMALPASGLAGWTLAGALLRDGDVTAAHFFERDPTLALVARP
jgi:hypothetical protein